MATGGRNLWRPSAPNTLLKQRHLEQVAQDQVQAAFRVFRERSLCQCSVIHTVKKWLLQINYYHSTEDICGPRTKVLILQKDGIVYVIKIGVILPGILLVNVKTFLYMTLTQSWCRQAGIEKYDSYSTREEHSCCTSKDLFSLRVISHIQLKA